MARCGCSDGTCDCVVEGSGSVVVVGGGTEASPYTVLGPTLQAADTATIDMIVSGTGTAASPWVVSANALVSLDELTDVATSGSTTGQVLARKSDGTFWFISAPTAAPGLISTDGTLDGDGSAGDPLRVVDAGGNWLTYTPTLSTNGSIQPTLGAGSTLLGRYAQIGDVVHFMQRLEIGSGFKRGDGYLRISLPPILGDATSFPICQAILAIEGGPVRYHGAGDVSTVNAGPFYFTLSESSNRSYGLSHSQPSSLPIGSYLRVLGTYQAD